MSVIADAFERVVRERGDEVLLVAPGEHTRRTARDIDDLSRELEASLAHAGLREGDLVLCLLGNRAAMPSLVLACVRGTLPLMPVEPGSPVPEILALARQWGAAAVVGGSDLPIVTEPGGTIVPLPGGLTAWVARARPEPRHHGAMLLKLTSGSTGAPRATFSEERHLVADVQHIVAGMDIGPHTRQLGVIPASHSYGFSNLILPLLWQGSPLTLRTRFVPTHVGEDIARDALETFAGVPFMFEHLVRHRPDRLPSSLRVVVSAGARLDFATVRGFHAATGLKIRSFYGSSETGGICFDKGEALDPEVPVGHPLGGTRVTLVEDADAPPGSGRVLVEGPSVIDRYAADDVARLDGRHLTGDYGRWHAGGSLVLTGRAGSFVNVAGRKVQPREVEDVLRSLPGVTDAIVLAITDAVRGETLGACVAAPVVLAAVDVRAALAQQLAPYKLPRVLITLPALPLTPRGKIDRALVLRLLQAQHR